MFSFLAIHSLIVTAAWWRWGGGRGACHKQVEHRQRWGVPRHRHGEKWGGGAWYHWEPDLNIKWSFAQNHPETSWFSFRKYRLETSIFRSCDHYMSKIVCNWHFIVAWEREHLVNYDDLSLNPLDKKGLRLTWILFCVTLMAIVDQFYEEHLINFREDILVFWCSTSSVGNFHVWGRNQWGQSVPRWVGWVEVNFTPHCWFPVHQVGVYIHWPYCARKCTYCNFNKYVVDSVDHER